MKTIARIAAAGLALLRQAQKNAPNNDITAQAEQVFRSSFRADNPKYWMTRLDQDEAMRLCSQYRDNPPAKLRAQIEKAQMATIRYPVEAS
jgi:sulfur-oxidizing protein SoxX